MYSIVFCRCEKYNEVIDVVVCFFFLKKAKDKLSSNWDSTDILVSSELNSLRQLPNKNLVVTCNVIAILFLLVSSKAPYNNEFKCSFQTLSRIIPGPIISPSMKALIKTEENKNGNKRHTKFQLCMHVLSTDTLLRRMPGTRASPFEEMNSNVNFNFQRESMIKCWTQVI